MEKTPHDSASQAFVAEEILVGLGPPSYQGF
jgi:hypothetical protein